MNKTSSQYDSVITECRSEFAKKLKDYGASWRIFRPVGITDQIFIKANRIRTLEEKRLSLVGEGIIGEFRGIINYSLIALIQIETGAAKEPDMTAEQALALYDKHAAEVKALMEKKNHDYGEAWRDMRTESFTDMILVKLLRIRQIESNSGQTIISEGIEANFHDIINYAVFALIKLTQE
jgi:hypothetical protein